MGEVKLYQRSQLPPSRVGAVKPPDIPEISTGEVVAEIAGDVLEKTWEAQAANEESEYLGFVSTTLEEINTAVADNPNMSPDKLKKLKRDAFKKFDAAAGSAVMAKTKQFIKNFNLRNRKLLEQKMDTRIEEIKTRQELERFKVNRINTKARRDMPGLEKLYDDQVAAGLMDSEVSVVAFRNDVLENDALQEMADEEKARVERTQMLEQFAEAGRNMILPEATKFFNEISREAISEPERNGLIAQRKRQEEIVTATTKNKQDQTSREMLLRLWGNELTQDEVEIAFANKWLSETQAKSLRASLLDPKIPKTDFLKAYENVNEAISDFRKNRKTKEETIDVLYGNLKNISQEDGEQLLNRIYEIAKPDSALNRPTAKRAFTLLEEYKDIRLSQLKSAKATDQEAKEELLLWFGLKNDFEQWLLSEERTDKQIEEKLRGMTRPVAEEITLNWFESLILAKEATPFLGKYTGTTEEEKLIKKKIKALEKEGVWDDLTEDEKNTIRQAFKAGKTVQDVLDIIGQ